MRKFILPVAAMIIAGGAYLAYAQTYAQQNTPTDSNAAPNIVTKPDTSKPIASTLIKNAPLATDFVMGKKDAPVVMVEYASLSCPHCAHFDKEVLPKLKEKYIDTGKLIYILRMFPLNAPAMTGAMLVHCVGKESDEKYYTFTHVLFDAQDKWAFDANYVTSLQTIAAVGGVDGEQFKACLNKDRETELLKLKKLANDELKVPHTPYFYIGGYAYEGAKNFEEISKFIDAKRTKK